MIPRGSHSALCICITYDGTNTPFRMENRGSRSGLRDS